MESHTKHGVKIRALNPHDLDAVVAIDAAIEGRARRAYFQRRLAAALRQPEQHVQLAAVDGAGVAGFILARQVLGEFGRAQPGLRIEIVGVRPELRGQGIGRMLLDTLSGWARPRGVTELRTDAAWNDPTMLGWLDAMGFELAPNHVVECVVRDGVRSERGDALDLPEGATASTEIDYGAPEDNDFERVAKVQADVRPMLPDDLPQIIRIDREITGRDRGDYIAGKLGEAMDDSDIRVSLTARLDGAIVGYLMARADLGDFGRAEPVAVLDTIGIDPDYRQRGVGRALVSQLFVTLGALRVDGVETVVAPEDLELLGFLYRSGFKPSKQLPFVRKL